MSSHQIFRRSSIAALSTLALVAGLQAGAGAAETRDPLTPRSTFKMAADGSSGTTKSGAGIPNIDSVKATIRTYYNATDGIADKTKSPYITEIGQLLTDQNGYLAQAAADAKKAGTKPAIVLDTDDTTLWTYDMEDAEMAFIFDPDLQDVWVQGQKFPATPGMVDFVDKAVKQGFTIFGLTGRSDKQKDATLANLAKVGYTGFAAANFFTKWTGEGTSVQPSYITCAAAKCTTVEYKAGTRKHIINDLGYDIVLNVGDQWSDLQGGFADKTLKLPNPTYYLPSPNLAGVSEPVLAPKTRFTMAPDGSSGATEGGEGIPNIDSVKATIRAYYNATDGIANRKTSRYITEMQKLSGVWGPRLKDKCTRLVKRGERPAIVLDADDTTLWTYDMEDADMGFNFDPALQDQWVQGKKFRPTPGMRRVVKSAAKGGCKIVGLTGRGDDQRRATIMNLNKYYAGLFKSKFYFTKWADGKQPSWVTCATDDCTRVEFKSQVRKHVEKKFNLHIIANFGDQFSDLQGGYADKAVKLPNPTYYLP